MSQTNEESIAKTAQIQLNELFAMILWEAEKFWTPNNEWNREIRSKIVGNLRISPKNRK